MAMLKGRWNRKRLLLVFRRCREEESVVCSRRGDCMN